MDAAKAPIIAATPSKLLPDIVAPPPDRLKPLPFPNLISGIEAIF